MPQQIFLASRPELAALGTRQRSILLRPANTLQNPAVYRLKVQWAWKYPSNTRTISPLPSWKRKPSLFFVWAFIRAQRHIIARNWVIEPRERIWRLRCRLRLAIFCISLCPSKLRQVRSKIWLWGRLRHGCQDEDMLTTTDRTSQYGSMKYWSR